MLFSKPATSCLEWVRVLVLPNLEQCYIGKAASSQGLFNFFLTFFPAAFSAMHRMGGAPKFRIIRIPVRVQAEARSILADSFIDSDRKFPTHWDVMVVKCSRSIEFCPEFRTRHNLNL